MWNTKIVACLIGLLSLCISSVFASYYCKADDDCKHFGELKCIKSQCDYGICSCKPRYAARFFGDWGKFKCVPLRKIGEECSPDGKHGLCGAPNSVCNAKWEECQCQAGSVPASGNERCVTLTQRLPGEYCTAEHTNCDANSINSAIDMYAPPHIDCSSRQHLVLSNQLSDQYFLSSTYPMCKGNVIGSPCLEDNDCANIKERNTGNNGDQIGGVCDTTTKKCKCKTASRVAQVGGTYCGLALAFDAVCTIPGTWDNTAKARKICDGTKGLICGDPCVQTQTILKCKCAVTHTTSGTTCTARTEGSACFGDENCKAIALTAVCESSKCKSVPSFQTGSGVDSFRPVLTFIILGVTLALKMITF
ncbi:uncharacterized protein LOC135495433 isoform X2 [Lineus longissimus]|uniref:uncharacterized protein LOC135495433 isoform X2 n=1 Tax=Lineus longissimus TaxID=88925 RepID=UPI00315CC40C